MKESDLIKHLVSKKYTTEKITELILRFREKTLKPRENFNDYLFLLCKKLAYFRSINVEQKWVNVLSKSFDNLFNVNSEEFYLYNLPPRLGKTTIITICGSAFILGRSSLLYKSEIKILIVCSSSRTLENVINAKIRLIIDSVFFKELFPDLKIVKINTQIIQFSNNSSISFIVSGSNAIGDGFHFVFFDDFMNPNNLNSEASMSRAEDHLIAFLGRKEYSPRTKSIIVEQRIAVHDTTAKFIKLLDSGKIRYNHIILPYEITSDISIFNIHFSQGEFLDKKFNEADKNQQRTLRGEVIWQTQYQQNPIEDETTFFVQKNSLSYYSDFYYEYLPYRNDVEYFVTCDTALKTGKANDFTVCLLFATFYKNVDNTGVDKQKIIFVVDMLRGKWIDPIPEVYAFYQKWKDFINYAPIYIEDKVNGTALIHELRNRHITSIGISRTNDIESRMGVVNNYITSGLLHLPTKLYINAEYSHNYPIQNDFVEDFERELLSFRRQNTKTRAGHDDIVSCLIDGLAIAYNPQSLKLIKS